MSFLWLTTLSALRILRRNPLRAGLTMLGIIIGIGAVVAMVSLGQGATASVQAEIASLGTNVLIIVPGATTVGGVRGGLGSNSTLTVDDAEDIERKVGGVTTVIYASRSVLQVISENRNWSTVVLGTTPEFIDIRNWPIAQGNFFTQSDMNSVRKGGGARENRRYRISSNLAKRSWEPRSASETSRSASSASWRPRASRLRVRTRTIWWSSRFRPRNERSSAPSFSGPSASSWSRRRRATRFRRRR